MDVSQRTKELRQGLSKLGIDFIIDDNEELDAHVERTVFSFNGEECSVSYSFWWDDDGDMHAISMGWPCFMELVVNGKSQMVEPWEVLEDVRNHN